LVGVEPDDVPLRAGPTAAQAAAAQSADALAFEGEVVLGAEASQTLDAPATLGLLAHELTHIARRAAPRFVPPVARDAGPAASASDEEALALRVEARVARAAAQVLDGSTSVEPSAHSALFARAPRAARRAVPRLAAPGGRERGTATPRRAAPAGVPASGPAAGNDALDPEAFDFGGLPAPWEPLPNWVTDAFTPAAPVGAPAAVASFAGADGAAPLNAPPVQRAGEERAVEQPAAAPGAAAQTPGAAQQAAPPDLDELARQVYGILRRRLAAEARRAG
jgi:hypothetical protein